MPGLKKPRDLVLLELEPKPWPLAERTAAAKACHGEYDFKLVAVAITLIQHPDEIPNGNCCGVLCHGQYEPWGLHRSDIERTIPAGYVMLNEDTPLIAFANPQQSLQYLINMVTRRRIYMPDEYSKFLLNLEPGSAAWGEAMIAFESALNTTIQHW